jgi:hypothetical protein
MGIWLKSFINLTNIIVNVYLNYGNIYVIKLLGTFYGGIT